MSGDKNFKNIDQLKEELERQKKNKYDLVVPSDQLIVFTEGNKIYMTVPQTDGSKKDHDITDYCHSQISWKTGIPMKYYNKMLDEIFKEIEVMTKGFVPVGWRKKGSTKWKKCIYSKVKN